MPLLVEELDWDDWNDEHVSRHGIKREEVEQVCLGDHWAIRVAYGKYLIYGQTTGGRYVVVVVAHRLYSTFYPITRAT